MATARRVGQTPRPAPAIRVAAGVALALALAGAVAAIIYGVRQNYLGRETPFVYDLTRLRQTDPNLIVCTEVDAPFPTGLSESRAIAAAPDGSLVVSGDLINSMVGCVMRACGPPQITDAPVQWVGGVVYDAQSPNGRTTLDVPPG